MTLSDTSQWWIYTYIRPDAHLMLGHIDVANNTILQIEQKDMPAILPPGCLFKCVFRFPSICVCTVSVRTFALACLHTYTEALHSPFKLLSVFFFSLCRPEKSSKVLYVLLQRLKKDLCADSPSSASQHYLLSHKEVCVVCQFLTRSLTCADMLFVCVCVCRVTTILLFIRMSHQTAATHKTNNSSSHKYSGTMICTRHTRTPLSLTPTRYRTCH